MQTKIIEATNQINWGKFLLGRPDHEWGIRSSISDSQMPLLREVGWSREHLWVLDLQTGEGACFRINPYGHAKNDLNKHRIWVCPMYEPFLEWLYRQPVLNFDVLPAVVELQAEASFHGYRREGRQDAT